MIALIDQYRKELLKVNGFAASTVDTNTISVRDGDVLHLQPEFTPHVPYIPSGFWSPKPRDLLSSLIQHGRLAPFFMTHERSGIPVRVPGIVMLRLFKYTDVIRSIDRGVLRRVFPVV